MASSSITWQALKFDLNRGVKYQADVKIAVEEEFSLRLNGKPLVKMTLTPSFLEEWAVGYLFYKGLVNSKEDIEKVSVDGNNIVVSAASPGEVEERLEGSRDTVSADVSIAAQLVSKISTMLDGLSKTFKETGGTHIAVLFDNGKPVVYMEDVGRHNAVDKVVGSCVLHNVETKGKILAVSGRITGEMVFKCLRAKIPILISPSAPLSKGLQTARMAGITLVGFARKRTFNVYTHPYRVVSH